MAFTDLLFFTNLLRFVFCLVFEVLVLVFYLFAMACAARAPAAKF
jgi:hypothetical protein